MIWNRSYGLKVIYFFVIIGPKTPRHGLRKKLKYPVGNLFLPSQDHKSGLNNTKKQLQNCTKWLTHSQETPGAYLMSRNQGASRSYQIGTVYRIKIVPIEKRLKSQTDCTEKFVFHFRILRVIIKRKKTFFLNKKTRFFNNKKKFRKNNEFLYKNLETRFFQSKFEKLNLATLIEYGRKHKVKI